MDSALGLDATPRRAVATYNSYEDAQTYVNRLANLGFPVDHVVIVGSDPVIVEHVTGRLDLWRAMLSGAMSGALIGLLFGWIWGLWFAHDGTSLLAIVAYWLGAGIIFGALTGLIAYGASGRRKYTSESTLTARNYVVLVDERFADEAQRLMMQSRQPNVAAPADVPRA